MAITIDEVTADVEPPRTSDSAAASATQASRPTPAQDRRQRERLERIRVRAARVCAD